MEEVTDLSNHRRECPHISRDSKGWLADNFLSVSVDRDENDIGLGNAPSDFSGEFNVTDLVFGPAEVVVELRLVEGQVFCVPSVDQLLVYVAHFELSAWVATRHRDSSEGTNIASSDTCNNKRARLMLGEKVDRRLLLICLVHFL